MPVSVSTTGTPVSQSRGLRLVKIAAVTDHHVGARQLQERQLGLHAELEIARP